MIAKDKKDGIVIPNGMIELDSDFAIFMDLPVSSFSKDTYLVGNSSQNQVIIPMLISNHPGQGHFSKAIKKLLRDGIRVSIQTPVPKMQEILTAWGFEIIWDAQEGVEYWMSPPIDAKMV